MATKPRSKRPARKRPLRIKRVGKNALPIRPFDMDRFFGKLKYDGDPVEDQRADRGRGK